MFFLQACGSNSADEQKERLRPAGVKITEAVKGDISTEIHATGTILPKDEAYIGPVVSGRIEKFFVDEGDFTEKGDPLLQLEQIRFSLALKEAKAAYAESLAQLKNTELKLKRNRELFEKNIIDKEILDNIKTDAELTRARADIARARFERAEQDLKDSVLYAPYRGFIVERKMNKGEFYSTLSNDYVLHLVDTSSVRIEVNIIETKKQWIKAGKKVLVFVDAIPGKTFDGEITTVNPLIDPVSRKFLVKIEIPKNDFTLESGMFARVMIPEEKRTNTLLVPADALVNRDGKRTLFVAEEKRAVIKQVRTGLITHELVEILDGIKEGDSVIVDGMYAVKDGTPLLIQE